MKLFLGLSAVALAIAVGLVLIWPFGAQAASCPHGSTAVRASWYGQESGNRTANGEYFDGTSLTAAMPSRSHLGERYRVTYRGKSVVVRINDVGPAAWTGRGIDLSRAAAKRIGFIAAGVGTVCLQRL